MMTKNLNKIIIKVNPKVHHTGWWGEEYAEKAEKEVRNAFELVQLHMATLKHLTVDVITPAFYQGGHDYIQKVESAMLKQCASNLESYEGSNVALWEASQFTNLRSLCISEPYRWHQINAQNNPWRLLESLTRLERLEVGQQMRRFSTSKLINLRILDVCSFTDDEFGLPDVDKLLKHSPKLEHIILSGKQADMMASNLQPILNKLVKSPRAKDLLLNADVRLWHGNTERYQNTLVCSSSPERSEALLNCGDLTRSILHKSAQASPIIRCIKKKQVLVLRLLEHVKLHGKTGKLLQLPYLDQIMHFAAERGMMKFLKALFEMGASPNLRVSSDNETLLHTACKGEQFILGFLIEHGVDINATNFRGRTALFHTLTAPKFLGFLLEHGARLDIYDSESRSVLHAYALASGNRMPSTVLPSLLEYDASKPVSVLNHCDHLGRTALRVAALVSSGSVIMQFLSTPTIDVSVKDYQGNTALHIVVQRATTLSHSQEILSKMLTKDPNLVHVQNDAGQTALIRLVKYAATQVAEAASGRSTASPAKPINGSKRIPGYTIKNVISLAKHLLDAGANVNAVDQFGKSALHHAASAPMINARIAIKLIELLKSYDASVSLKDESGKTPLELAKQETLKTTLLRSVSFVTTQPAGIKSNAKKYASTKTLPVTTPPSSPTKKAPTQSMPVRSRDVTSVTTSPSGNPQRVAAAPNLRTASRSRVSTGGAPTTAVKVSE